MATKINLQNKKPKIIYVNNEDSKPEEALIEYLTYPLTEEHLWLASSQYIDRLSAGRKHWADELIVYLNVPRTVTTEPLLNADTRVGIAVGLLVDI